jgi:hypothetical protein
MMDIDDPHCCCQHHLQSKLVIITQMAENIPNNRHQSPKAGLRMRDFEVCPDANRQGKFGCHLLACRMGADTSSRLRISRWMATVGQTDRRCSVTGVPLSPGRGN